MKFILRGQLEHAILGVRACKWMLENPETKLCGFIYGEGYKDPASVEVIVVRNKNSITAYIGKNND